jgi:hypothetical protein
VLEVEVFIGEFLAIDRLAAGAIAFGEVAALAHKVWDHAMKSAPLVAEPLLACTQRPKVFSSLRHHVRTQFNDNPAQLFAVRCDVKKALGELILIGCTQH